MHTLCACQLQIFANKTVEKKITHGIHVRTIEYPRVHARIGSVSIGQLIVSQMYASFSKYLSISKYASDTTRKLNPFRI